MKLYCIPILIAVSAAGIMLIFIKKKSVAEQKREIEYEAQNELLHNIKKFQGFFQILDNAVNTSNEELAQRVLRRWKKETAKMPCLSCFLNQLLNEDTGVNSLYTGKQLLDRFEAWGIQHDQKGKILTADKELNKFYIMDEFYENGEQLTVETPCWYCKVGSHTICIEPGTAAIIKIDEEK